jgi:hypothetical protein
MLVLAILEVVALVEVAPALVQALDLDRVQVVVVADQVVVLPTEAVIVRVTVPIVLVPLVLE